MAEDSEYVLEPLREQADFTLYRGRARRDQMPVLAVALAAGRPSPQNLRRLDHEYSLATELDAAWAAQPLALTSHQGRAVLILKDPGGGPLDRIVEQQQGKPLDLTRFLSMAIGLAAALRQAHRRGLIHKDVKPANALVDDDGRAWLTGFGIASRLPRERQAPAPLESIGGTLAYMSPEQTGRMNRSMDSRSDLYSLGVTLYQMLTGILPFTAADPLEWVHCHIARQPVAPVDRREVPEPVSAIIMRLLAKNAEERYQTAAGLEADLRRCLSEWQAHGRIDPFPLGKDDASDRLLIPEKLYGRVPEVAGLLTAFDRVVAQGTAELVLVSGYSGIGKSSVVNELHKVLVPPRGLFAAGKFDQVKRDVPYATLAQAFQTLIRDILVKSEPEVAQWRRVLLEALGSNGQLMVKLVPELEFVIGKQPPVSELPPLEARGRFQLVFRRLLGAFARPEHPLALFLDDLQWLDTATLELLESLIIDPDLRHVLLVGAYRDNEVGSSHPLTRTLAAIRTAGARVHEIALAPLGLDDVERLVAEALHCHPDSAAPLALLAHEKTGGNPFFTIQFLLALTEEGLLRFDRKAATWLWQLDQIRAKDYSGNVVDLMLAKLRRLPHATQTALQQLACLGNVADIALLSLGLGQPEERIHAPLWEAVRSGLIVRLEGSYSFLHDRIQEAAYALIPESARAEVHLRIGRTLLAGLTAGDLANHLFDVANQMNRGASLLTDHVERVQVAGIGLRAGRQAKASAAYTSARDYFAAGIALLDENDWSARYELTFSLWLERVECELLSGNPQKAGQLIEQLLPLAASKVDAAAVYHLKVQLQVMTSDIQQAVVTALTCLRGFGIDLPAHPTDEQVWEEYEAVWHALDGRSIESLIDLPLVTDPELQAAMTALSDLFAPAKLTGFNLACLQICRLVKISLRHGMSGASAYACASWVSGPGWFFRRYDEAYRFARLACDLIEKHGFIASQAKVYASTAAAAIWTQPITTAIEFNRKSIQAATEMGDLAFACFPMSVSIPYRLVRNDSLDVLWRDAEMQLDFARKVRFLDIADIIVSQQRFIATMQGRTTTFSTFSDDRFGEAAFEAQLTAGRMPMLPGSYWILKLQARFLSGDFAEALAAADKARQFLEALAIMTQLLDYHYYTALTVSALYEGASADQQAAWRELLRSCREQLHDWAENNPSTFADKLALVSAEIARIEKRDAEALRLYEEAISFAREQGFVQNEGLAHELAARYCLTQRLETAGHAHLLSARECYDRWGAHGKVQQLDGRYPWLREARAPAASATPASSNSQLDIETIVKASQALSSEIVLPELIEKLLRIAVENAGAERALLILFRGGARNSESRIEAEATTRQGKVDVIVRPAVVTPSDLPQSVLHYVVRTQEVVLLDDASADKVYSKDEYVRQHRSRSALCLPILQQQKLIGALYLENNLTPGAFTPSRAAVLQLLASQAAISLENATLYSDLQREGRNFRHIIDTIPGFLCTMTAQGQVEFLNQGILDYTGWTAEQLADWRPLLHPDECEMVTTRWIRSVETGSPYHVEHRILGADGLYRWFVVRGLPIRDADGSIVRWYVLITDIDERRRTHEKLQYSEAFLAQAQRISQTGSFGWRLASGEIYWSDETYNILECERAAKPSFELVFQRVHPDDRSMVQRTIDDATRDRKDFDIEHRLLMPDGRVRNVHVTGRAVKTGNVDFVGAVRDITERTQAEEALRQAQDDLARINRMTTMGELTASLAHELNQPISGALINVNVCLRNLGRDKLEVDELRAAITRLARDTQRAADIIGRIHSQFRQDARDLEAVDINEITQQTVALLRDEALRHNISVRTELAADLPRIAGDRVQLQQVAMNLIVNGIEAMKEVAGAREMVITSQRAENEEILLSVSDTGIGFPPQLAKRIFDPFFTTKPQGTGMGLRICRSIIESHGGRLWAVGAPGRGATFHMSLPTRGHS
ncbi:MAG TPA: AAA family ATPase [Steroidobacteraceae bacterium]|nr:AAA family ATPase [Steroidobacteraceae bacterium]